mgnify:CR=1 FL=1
MKLKIEQWGDELAIRLPLKHVQKYNLKAGQTVHIEADNSGIYCRFMSVFKEMCESIPKGKRVEQDPNMEKLMKEQGEKLF